MTTTNRLLRHDVLSRGRFPHPVKFLVVVAFLAALAWMLASCEAQAEPKPAADVRWLASFNHTSVHVLDYGDTRCFVVANQAMMPQVGGISCVVRAKP